MPPDEEARLFLSAERENLHNPNKNSTEATQFRALNRLAGGGLNPQDEKARIVPALCR